MARKNTENPAIAKNATVETESIEALEVETPETAGSPTEGAQIESEVLPALENGVGTFPETVEETTETEISEEELAELEERREKIIVPFLAEFGSSERRKNQIRKLLEDGAKPKEFADEFGKSPSHKKYLAKRFSDAAARLARVD